MQMGVFQQPAKTGDTRVQRHRVVSSKDKLLSVRAGGGGLFYLPYTMGGEQ